jgi:hypothetical protein
MRNITALEFARLFSDLLLVETLPREEVAAKLRELADMVDSRRLVLHEAYSMEAVHEKLVAETTLILRFYQQFEEGLADINLLKKAKEISERVRARKKRRMKRS